MGQVVPFRKRARTEAEIYVAKQRESMTLRLMQEQVEQRRIKETLRFYEAAAKESV